MNKKIKLILCLGGAALFMSVFVPLAMAAWGPPQPSPVHRFNKKERKRYNKHRTNPMVRCQNDYGTCGWFRLPSQGAQCLLLKGYDPNTAVPIRGGRNYFDFRCPDAV